ncbi:hypothetical protein EC973_007510 [Apophysomyces ossiformis]|uniref:Rab-GAP TBC domain-containing protein n=1 Tax=Apophysomyces ossiformis TaxID=679940 RepID=A0A8H7BRS8_9FUNG|nr:hypothetical protein EC973_007510 [Apophysomyces ossiformis]
MNLDDDLSTVNDFLELLQSEVHVDLERLRILARHGIPAQLRGEVWMYLLGVQQADRCKKFFFLSEDERSKTKLIHSPILAHELSLSKARTEEYNQMDKVNMEAAKRIRGEVTRYQRRVPQLEGKHNAEAFENIISAYLNANRDTEYHPEEYYTGNTIKERVANFMTLFRYVLPDLCNYFEEEEVDLNEWVTSWLSNLLAREMQFEDLVRLWGKLRVIQLKIQKAHPSILRHAKEKLEDLEQSEIRTVLLRLPRINMSIIIAEAHNLYHETIERQMSEDGELA